VLNNPPPEEWKCLSEVLMFHSVSSTQNHSALIIKETEESHHVPETLLKCKINTFLYLQPPQDSIVAVHENLPIFTRQIISNKEKISKILKLKPKLLKIVNLYKPFNITKTRKLKHLICLTSN
jgi:uncharacterized membrane protein